MKLCDICGENEAVEMLGVQSCCQHCYDFYQDEFEKEQEKKEIDIRKDNIIFETENKIKTALENKGYEITNVHYAESGTHYYTAVRGSRTITVRLADHSDCYATADYNICIPETENLDGILIETFIKKLR